MVRPPCCCRQIPTPLTDSGSHSGQVCEDPFADVGRGRRSLPAIDAGRLEALVGSLMPAPRLSSITATLYSSLPVAQGRQISPSLMFYYRPSCEEGREARRD